MADLVDSKGDYAQGGTGSTPPRAVRLAILALTALLLAGGAWLVAVRGEAVLIDLYAASKLLLCF